MSFYETIAYDKVKPRGPLRINQQSSLARGLVWMALPGLEDNIELLNRGKGKLMASTSWGGASPMGSGALSTNSSTGGIFYPWSEYLTRITNQFSIIVWAEIKVIEAFSHLLTIPYSSTWTSPFYAIQFLRDNTTSNVSLAWTVGGSGATAQGVTNGFITTGGLACFGVTANEAGVARFFKNGVFGEQATRGGGGGNVDFGNKREVTLLNHNSAAAGEGIAGVTTYAAIWNRTLSDAEMRSAYTYPFQMLERPLWQKTRRFGVDGSIFYDQTKSRHTQKPLFPKIDRKHPIGKNVVYDFLLSNKSLPWDTVSGISGNFSANNPSFKSTPFGDSLNFTVNPSAYISKYLGSSGSEPVQYSVEFIMSRRSGGIGGGYGLLVLEGNNTKTANRWDFYNDNASVGYGMVFEGFFGGGTGSSGWSIPYPIDTNFHHYVITYDHSGLNTTPLFYVDGVLTASTNRYTGVGSPTFPNNTVLTLGNSPNLSDNTWDGQIIYVRKYNRILSSGEARSLYQAPYQIYIPTLTYKWGQKLVYPQAAPPVTSQFYWRSMTGMGY